MEEPVEPGRSAIVDRIVDGIAAGLGAALPSGLPSTLHALVIGRDVLETSRAAGTIALRDDRASTALVTAAIPVHISISAGWGAVLGIALPRQHTIAWGALAGVAIAALDLSAAARWWPRVRALPQGPQIADHIAFGAIAGYVIARRRADREGRIDD